MMRTRYRPGDTLSKRREVSSGPVGGLSPTSCADPNWSTGTSMALRYEGRWGLAVNGSPEGVLEDMLTLGRCCISSRTVIGTETLGMRARGGPFTGAPLTTTLIMPVIGLGE